MGIIQETGRSIVTPIQAIGESFLYFIPGIIAAIIILVIGWFIAKLISWVVKKICVQINLDKWVMDKTNLAKLSGKFELSKFLTLITKWYVFILFLPPAAHIVNMVPLSTFLLSVAFWIPSVILALIIAFLGFIAADYVAEKVKETKAKYAKMLGDILRIIIIVFVLIIALKQMRLDISMAEHSFLIILGGIMLAISLAIGIGFGLGLKEESKPMIKNLKKKFL